MYDSGQDLKVLLDSSDHFLICSFINVANLTSNCSRVLCSGSDTANIEKA